MFNKTELEVIDEALGNQLTGMNDDYVNTERKELKDYIRAKQALILSLVDSIGVRNPLDISAKKAECAESNNEGVYLRNCIQLIIDKHRNSIHAGVCDDLEKALIGAGLDY